MGKFTGVTTRIMYIASPKLPSRRRARMIGARLNMFEHRISGVHRRPNSEHETGFCAVSITVNHADFSRLTARGAEDVLHFLEQHSHGICLENRKIRAALPILKPVVIQEASKNQDLIVVHFRVRR